MPRISISRGVAAALMFSMSFPVAAQDTAPKPTISDTPLTAEQLGVYRAMLVNWFQAEKFKVNLAELTLLPGSMDEPSEADCSKRLSLEKQATEVHRFQQTDLAQLGIGSSVHLVDPDAHAQQVRAHDPGDAIQNGKSVDDAVKDGFSNGLFTLGEIRFDQSHTHAIVSFRFWCGRLCGHGSTMLLEKKNGSWKQKRQCGGWIS